MSRMTTVQSHAALYGQALCKSVCLYDVQHASQCMSGLSFEDKIATDECDIVKLKTVTCNLYHPSIRAVLEIPRQGIEARVIQESQPASTVGPYVDRLTC